MRQKNILKILTDSDKLFSNSPNNEVRPEVDIMCEILDEYKRLKKICPV